MKGASCSRTATRTHWALASRLARAARRYRCISITASRDDGFHHVKFVVGNQERWCVRKRRLTTDHGLRAIIRLRPTTRRTVQTRKKPQQPKSALFPLIPNCLIWQNAFLLLSTNAVNDDDLGIQAGEPHAASCRWEWDVWAGIASRITVRCLAVPRRQIRGDLQANVL